MGSILKAECSCGFVTTFPAGGGVLNFTDTCFAPAICVDCGEFFIRNYFSKFIKCPKCHKKAYFYDNPSLHSNEITDNIVFSWNLQDEREFILYDKDYLCPKCKQFSLRFSELGFFD